MIDAEILDFAKNTLKSVQSLEYRIDSINTVKMLFGFVLKVLEEGDEFYKSYPEGSAIIKIPDNEGNYEHQIIAIPIRNSHGAYELPDIGTTVLINVIGSKSLHANVYYYSLQAPLMQNVFYENREFLNYYNIESVGFEVLQNADSNHQIAGRYGKKVFENVGKAKIVASTNTFVIYQNETDKELEIRGGDDYIVKLYTGNNGSIKIGFLDYSNDTDDTGSADIELNAGISGNIDFKTMDGVVTIETTSGDIKFETTTGIIKLITNEDIELEPGSGKKVWIKGDLYVDGDIKWNYSTTPTTASTHIHGTGVGPSAAPNPGS